jgi:hypothetical protein
MSTEFIFRIIGMVIVAILGWSLGGQASRIEPFIPEQELLYRMVFGLIGALAGLVLTPYSPLVLRASSATNSGVSLQKPFSQV